MTRPRTATVTTADVPDTTWTTPSAPASGRARQGRDRTRFALPGLRVSTATAAVAYPFLAQAPLTHKGTFLGTNMGTGAPFCYSPFELYRDGLITNPNILVAGEIGSGKTNTTCALTLRSIPLGFKVAAVDAKADWARFARAYGGVRDQHRPRPRQPPQPPRRLRRLAVRPGRCGGQPRSTRSCSRSPRSCACSRA